MKRQRADRAFSRYDIEVADRGAQARARPAGDALDRGAKARARPAGDALDRGAKARARAAGDAPRSRYREFAPPAPLAHALVCSWVQIVGEGAGELRHRVLPDGCVDLIAIGSAPPFAAGPATCTVVASLPPRTAIVGLRLRPGWAPRALGAPASALLDRDVPLRDLWGPSADVLRDHLLAAPSIETRVAALAQALLAREQGARPVDTLVVSAAGWLARRPDARVDEVARALGIAARQLRRRFAAAVGYGPKTFQRIARFQRLLDLAKRRRADRGLSELALAAGYADQAHMTREVGELAERTPATMLGRVGSTLVMADLFDVD